MEINTDAFFLWFNPRVHDGYGLLLRIGFFPAFYCNFSKKSNKIVFSAISEVLQDKKSCVRNDVRNPRTECMPAELQSVVRGEMSLSDNHD
jgi:hypothetical protein